MTYNSTTGVFVASTSPTYTTATTTNLGITSVSGALLKTLTDGAVVAAVAGTDYVTPAGLASAFEFTPSSLDNSTSTLIAFANGLISNASSTFTGTLNVGTLALTNALTIPNGGTGQSSLTAGNLIYGAGSGALQNVATTSVTAGTALSFTGTAGALVGGTNLTINFSAPASSALSIPFASSTAITATTLYSTLASTTNLNISGISSALLKTVNGSVVAAVAGTDYLTNAFKDWDVVNGYLTPTSTLGIIVNASSTIGSGTQTGGLTISGGATTTGNAYFAGNVGIGTTSLSKLTLNGELTLGLFATSSANQQLGTVVWNGTSIFAKTGNATTSTSGWVDLAGDNTVDVFLIGGQSNAVGAGNSAESPTVPHGEVLQYYNGTISDADDPVGAAGTGSAWPAFGNAYYAATGHRILFVPAAVNASGLVASTTVNNWDTTGNLWSNSVSLLAAATSSLISAGYDPVFKGVLWGQGEHDAQSIDSNLEAPSDYQNAFTNMLARYRAVYGAAMPFYIFETGTYALASDTGFADVRSIEEGIAGSDPSTHMVFRNAVDFQAQGLMNSDD